MKLKLAFSIVLLSSVTQLATGSDLDDAVNFANGKFNSCKKWEGRNQNSVFLSEYYPRQEILNSILYVDYEKQTGIKEDNYFSENFFQQIMVELKNLNSTVKTEVHPSKFESNKQSRYYIIAECADGKKCVNFKNFNINAGTRQLTKSSTESEVWIGVCSESDMNRAAKALSDAIRLSGGKTSKY